jgi:hypothetical protein
MLCLDCGAERQIGARFCSICASNMISRDDQPRSFGAGPKEQRAVVIAAGVSVAITLSLLIPGVWSGSPQPWYHWLYLALSGLSAMAIGSLLVHNVAPSIYLYPDGRVLFRRALGTLSVEAGAMLSIQTLRDNEGDETVIFKHTRGTIHISRTIKDLEDLLYVLQTYNPNMSVKRER